MVHQAAISTKPAGRPNSKPVTAKPKPETTAAEPLVFPERELASRPEENRLVTSLLEQFGWETTALARQDLAPMVFMGSRRKGLFYFNNRDGVLLAFSYLGPQAYLNELLKELLTYGESKGFAVNALTELAPSNLNDPSLAATPFGVMQRLPDLGSFHLQGNRMRRLRYMASKFEHSGTAKTLEYVCVAVIEPWTGPWMPSLEHGVPPRRW